MDSIDYKELFAIISSSKKKSKAKKDVDIDMVVSGVCERLKIKSCDMLRQKIINDIRKYCHYQTKVKAKKISDNSEELRIAINAKDYKGKMI